MNHQKPTKQILPSGELTWLAHEEMHLQMVVHCCVSLLERNGARQKHLGKSFSIRQIAFSFG